MNMHTCYFCFWGSEQYQTWRFHSFTLLFGNVRTKPVFFQWDLNRWIRNVFCCFFFNFGSASENIWGGFFVWRLFWKFFFQFATLEPKLQEAVSRSVEAVGLQQSDTSRFVVQNFPYIFGQTIGTGINKRPRIISSSNQHQCYKRIIFILGMFDF